MLLFFQASTQARYPDLLPAMHFLLRRTMAFKSKLMDWRLMLSTVPVAANAGTNEFGPPKSAFARVSRNACKYPGT
jgi:hypothetical protein